MKQYLPAIFGNGGFLFGFIQGVKICVLNYNYTPLIQLLTVISLAVGILYYILQIYRFIMKPKKN